MSRSRVDDAALLAYLKEQQRSLLLSEIEQNLGLGHSQVIDMLDRYAEQGYEIEFHPYLGVRLLDIPDRYLTSEIHDGLNAKVVGSTINVFERCGSTNDEAWKVIEAGQGKDGELFLAETQEQARGRMGRPWFSLPRASISLSFIARVRIAPEHLGYLTAGVALALANTLEQFMHLPPEIKWPNDVLIGGKKVAGILIESRSNHPDTFVVGIGLNVNQRPEHFPEAIRDQATSLRIERRAGDVHRIKLLRPLLFYLDSVYAQLRKRKYERVGRAWREYVHCIGKGVKVTAKNETLEGVLVDLDPGNGARLKPQHGPEISLRPEFITTIVQG